MGQNPTPILNTNDLNHGTRPEHVNSSQVNNTTNKNLPHTSNNPRTTNAHSSEVPNPMGNTTLSSKWRTVTQTSQGNETLTTLSEPTPMVGPKVNHVPSVVETHRDTAVISKHSHNIKDTPQSMIPPQKTIPAPNETQKAGREFVMDPTSTINQNNQTN